MKNRTAIKKTALVTGGCGFVGSNVAARLLKDGWHVVVISNLNSQGSKKNLAWLKTQGLRDFHKIDMRSFSRVSKIVESERPDAIVHLAGQVAMTTSMNDPMRDFNSNMVGTLNLLESVRRAKLRSAILYSSSNKVYGGLDGVVLKEKALRYVAPDYPDGLDESAPLDFQTPYGCSKGAADQYVLDYARSFGLNTVVFRHSTIYGTRQFATFNQGWIGWFVRQALEVQKSPSRPPFTISGDGKQVRDLLFIDDVVECYVAAVRNIRRVRGHALNIGGGMSNSCSLLELFAILEEQLGVKLKYTRLPWRLNDQKYFVADIGKARRLLGWKPKVSREEGIKRMIEWSRENI